MKEERYLTFSQQLAIRPYPAPTVFSAQPHTLDTISILIHACVYAEDFCFVYHSSPPLLIHFSIYFFKGIPRKAEVAHGFPVRLRPRIFSTFGITRVVGRQPNAPAVFIPGETAGTHFQRLSRPQGTWFCRKEPRKKSQVTPPRIDPGTVRLNHYATPGPSISPYTVL